MYISSKDRYTWNYCQCFKHIGLIMQQEDIDGHIIDRIKNWIVDMDKSLWGIMMCSLFARVKEIYTLWFRVLSCWETSMQKINIAKPKMARWIVRLQRKIKKHYYPKAITRISCKWYNEMKYVKITLTCSKMINEF